MTIYNVNYESNYENEDIHSTIVSYTSEEEAREGMKREILNEIADWGYSDDEVKVSEEKNRISFNTTFSDREWFFRATLTTSEIANGAK